MGGGLGRALEAELQVRPSRPAPFARTEQWAVLGFSSYLGLDRTQDSPCLLCQLPT